MVAPEGKLPLRTAVEARDHAAAVDAFAPDAVLRSPITGRFAFEGREQIGALLQVILDTFEDIRYIDELHHGSTAVLVAEARVGGADLELVDHMTLGEDGRIVSMTVFFRPMPATAVAMRLLGAGLGRRTGPLRGRVISVLAAPLGLIIAVADRVAARLVLPALRRPR